MAQLKKNNSEYPTTVSNPQHIISDWVDAITDFKEWNSKLVNVINTCNANDTNSLGYVAGNQEVIKGLMQLRCDVTDGLAKLLSDVNELNGDPSFKMEQLKTQTKTIRQYNEKIRDTLEINLFGKA